MLTSSSHAIAILRLRQTIGKMELVEESNRMGPATRPDTRSRRITQCDAASSKVSARATGRSYIRMVPESIGPNEANWLLEYGLVYRCFDGDGNYTEEGREYYRTRLREYSTPARKLWRSALGWTLWSVFWVMLWWDEDTESDTGMTQFFFGASCVAWFVVLVLILRRVQESNRKTKIQADDAISRMYQSAIATPIERATRLEGARRRD